MKQFLKYGTGLIALYLIVANGTKAGQAMTSGAGGASTVIKAFQGR